MWQRQYEGGAWRILWYRNDENCLKGETEKRKRRNFASGSARKPPFFRALSLSSG